MKKMRVRYAPSPTGLLHIGNARTALFNYVFARHYGADFIIRIEDTDKAREVEGGEDSQLENLAWLGVNWDESPREPNEKYAPYRQSERLAIYHKYALQLIKDDKAYWSYMTKEEQDAEREKQMAEREKEGLPKLYKHHYEYEGMSDEEITALQDAAKAKGIKPCIRLRILDDHVYEWKDEVKGKISFLGKDVGEGDWVIEKADGMPTYNFAVVIDDHKMEITNVIRGDDHVNNTPKQMMVYEAFGWETPVFAHMPLVLNAETGKKLSKRDKNTLQFIEDYRAKGFLPQAVFNFISLLGWNPGTNDEILSQEEIIKEFKIEKMSGAPAAFDQKKLNWINQQYVKKLTKDEFFDFCRPFLEQVGRLSDTSSAEEIARAKDICELYHSQLKFGEEIIGLTDIFYDSQIELSNKDKAIAATDDAKKVIKTFEQKLKAVEDQDFTEEKILAIVKETQAETKIKGKNLWMPIRVATSRESHGPELDKFIVLLGKDKVLKHIEKTLAEL